MPRSIRFIPEGGALVEVTDRTVQARFLLVPSLELNEVVRGVLGRAQRLYKVRICGFVALSNHIHALLWVDDAFQLANFMGYFASNLAREIARLTGWTDKIWARRYQAIMISDEEAAQTERFEYLLANGAKEGLVEHVRDWPGVHCVRNLLDGELLEGLWFDRTKEYSTRNRGKTISPGQHSGPSPPVGLAAFRDAEKQMVRLVELTADAAGEDMEERRGRFLRLGRLVEVLLRAHGGGTEDR
jgi:REP element-mobilizing transposase RayT